MQIRSAKTPNFGVQVRLLVLLINQLFQCWIVCWMTILKIYKNFYLKIRWILYPFKKKIVFVLGNLWLRLVTRPLNALYCLISYRAGDWHWEIFADFLKFRIQNGFQNKSWIKDQYITSEITPAKLPFYGIEQLLYYISKLLRRTKEQLLNVSAP